MSPIPAISGPQVLLFDTGPLWELVLYSAVRPPLRFARLTGDLKYLRSERSYQRLSEFVGSFRRKTTSPHVVAEISTRIIRTEQKGWRAIWGLVYREFSSMGMDEESLKLLEMSQELVTNLGAVDVSILEIGRRLGQSNPLILTIDSHLIAECSRAGVSTKHLREVVAGENP